jgi:hypothetical protein
MDRSTHSEVPHQSTSIHYYSFDLLPLGITRGTVWI